MKKTKILVSACLLGEACRYDGKSKPCDRVIALRESFELVPVCPEVLGGLNTPRIPSERVGDRVVASDGTDVTENYFCGAKAVLKIAKENQITTAVLKARSPACGKGSIYDGTFSRTLSHGDGVLTELLKMSDIIVYTEEEIDDLLMKINT